MHRPISGRTEQARGFATPSSLLVEPLEQRTLLAATTVSVVASIPAASESHRTTTGRGEFVFKRPTGDTTLPLVVRYAINGDSTATNGADFETLSGKVTIPAGRRSVAMNLFPINDSIDEPAERVIVSIKNQSTYSVVHRSAVVTIADNDPPLSIQGWWDDKRHFRAPLDVSVGGFARSGKTVEQAINFTSMLKQAGGSGAILDNSIRIVETNADGTQVIDENVPFQFDKSSGYDATTNASGNLIWVVKGSTSANATRHYHVYFDTAGAFDAFDFAPQVTTDANTSDKGQAAIKIDTLTATYWLQKANGGFSSIEDKSGNDWLGFDPTSGSEAGGEFRGTPNAVFPGGGFHAGFTTGSSTIINSGPLKTTIESTLSVDKQDGHGPYTFKMRYEIYGDHVTATMVQADSSYWFLYEGTPGGAVDGNDTVARSDGTVTGIDAAWNEDSGIGHDNGQEWVYFRDSAVGKYIYYVHNTPDSLKDSYYEMTSAAGSMTVFGFGRDNDAADPNRERMTAQNNTFTFGIADGGGDFDAASGQINGVYRPTAVTTGAGQKKV
jgi:hypothetical protein